MAIIGCGLRIECSQTTAHTVADTLHGTPLRWAALHTGYAVIWACRVGIAIISCAVAVGICLVGVGKPRTVVAYIGNSIAISIVRDAQAFTAAKGGFAITILGALRGIGRVFVAAFVATP
jgi:hypothetical protein